MYRRSLSLLMAPKEINSVNENVMHFATDKEFTDFCVAPYAEIVRSDKGMLFIEGRYSEEYLKCINAGKRFVIEDENSLVYKHKCVTKRVPVRSGNTILNRDTLVQLNVQNLKEYICLK